MQTGADRAIAILGGKSAAARQLGVSPQAVDQWKRIPIRHLFVLERLTGVSREELRPDLYLPPRPKKPLSR